MTGYRVPDLTDDDRELLDAIRIGAGCTIWRRAPEASDFDLVGGVVVRASDDGTEFRVVDWKHGRPVFHLIRLEEVDPHSVGLPNAAVIRSTARRLMAAASKTKGLSTGQELELSADAQDLLASIV